MNVEDNIMNMNIDNKELNDQLLGHITRLQAVYPRIWDVYCTEVNRGLLIGICKAIDSKYNIPAKDITEYFSRGIINKLNEIVQYTIKFAKTGKLEIAETGDII